MDKYIQIALKEAKKATKKGEVPVGAVIVKDNKVIAKAHNLVEKKQNATLHAEILAITKASKKINNWRLNDCEMYITLEPCKMCVEAIKASRLNKVYYILKKDKEDNNNTDFVYIENYEKESLNMIQSFFKNRR